MEYLSKWIKLFSRLTRSNEDAVLEQAVAKSPASDNTTPASTAPSVAYLAAMTELQKIEYGMQISSASTDNTTPASTAPSAPDFASMTEVQLMEYSLRMTRGFTPPSAADFASMTYMQKNYYGQQVEAAFLKTAIKYTCRDFASMSEEQHIACLEKSLNETHISIYSYNYYKENLMRDLKELDEMRRKTIDSEYVNGQTEGVLFLIFHVGRERTMFTETEKREFGRLVIENFKLIEKSVRWTLFEYTLFEDVLDMLARALLMRRSALQFLLENFAEFPAGKSTLLSELQKTNIMELIKEFDDWIEMVRTIAILASEYEYIHDREDIDVSKLPKSHVWWLK